MFVGLTFQKGLYGKKGAMRQSIRSTLSTATASSSSVRRAVTVVLLNKEELQVLVEPKGKVAEVFSQVCDNLGLRETEYFGLAQLIDGEYHFTDLDLKVSKLAPKVRHSLKHHPESQSVLTLHFRVQFYVDHVMLLRERVTRHQYYLQLRDNLLHAAQVCGAERCFLLAAYALQADLGSYSAHKHARAYFDPREYFPAWVISKHGSDYIVTSMPAMHSDLSGMTKMEAQMHYIKDVSAPPAAHNLHFYRLKKRKTDRLGTAWIGICPKGVEIYEELEDGFKNLLSTFLWPNIRKLIFEKKKFEIRAVGTPTGRKFTYYTGSDERAKYLLSLCRTTHQFQMDVQPKLAEIRHLEAEDKRRFRDNHREAYIYSDKRELDRDHGRASGRSHASYCSAVPTESVQSAPTRTPPTCGVLDQRVSVISNTSSNTTSGIVSDKMYMSFDDSEDYYQCLDDMRSNEIMIDSPPSKAPSNYGSYTTPHARVTPMHSMQVYPGPGLSSSPASLNRVGELPRPVSSSSRTHSSISRTSSCHSQRSGKLLLSTPVEVHSLPMPLPAPIPAEVHIQRMSLAPTMTVSSTPVPPGVGAVFSGVVTSGSPTPLPSMAYGSVVGSVAGGKSSPTYVNVSEMMGTAGQFVTGAQSPINYVTDMSSFVGQTFVAESRPIHHVATPVVSHSALSVIPTTNVASIVQAPRVTGSVGAGGMQSGYGPKASSLGGQSLHSLEYHHTTRNSMPSEYPKKVLSVANPPPMVVSSHPHVPPGVVAQQCLPVEASRPIGALSPSGPIGIAQPAHLPQQAPPLTPHLTHTHLAPPCTDQALPSSHHTPPTAHITPPILHKAPPPPPTISSTVATTAEISPLTKPHQPKLAAVPVPSPQPSHLNPRSHTPPALTTTTSNNGGMQEALSLVMPTATVSSMSSGHVLDHSVTVDDHTSGPSTPLMVLPPSVSGSNQALAVLTPATMVTPPDYPTTSKDQEPAAAKDAAPTKAASPSKSLGTTPSRSRPRGGLVPTGEAWGYSNDVTRGVGRAQQRHHSMGKYDQFLSPNAGRESEKRSRGRRSKTCPAHGLMPVDVAAELQGLTGKNLSLPLLSALCSDSSLIQQLQEKCSCSASASISSKTASRDEKNLSFSSPSATLVTNDGSGVRPVSWHSDTISLDQTFKLLRDEQLYQGDDARASPVIPGSRLSYSPPAKAANPALHPHMALLDPVPMRSHSDELASLTSSQLQASPLIAGLLAPSLGRVAVHSSGAKLSNSTGGAMFPSKLTSGGHSPNSSETLHQQASMGLA